jgi:hypothetical protein
MPQTRKKDRAQLTYTAVHFIQQSVNLIICIALSNANNYQTLQRTISWVVRDTSRVENATVYESHELGSNLKDLKENDEQNSSHDADAAVDVVARLPAVPQPNNRKYEFTFIHHTITNRRIGLPCKVEISARIISRYCCKELSPVECEIAGK